jgi:two-component sensor histidine kinase/PAS domain-containing protein
MWAVSAKDGNLTVAEKGRWGAVLALPLITILPVLLFAIATVAYLTQQQQHTLEREILQIARQSSQAADFLLSDRLSMLDALSSLAVEDDWQGFSYQSRHLVASRADWDSIFVQRPDGTIVSTEAASGVPNPSRLDVAPLGPGDMRSAILVQTAGTAPFLLVRKAIGHPEQGQLTVAAILSLEPFSRALADQADPNWTVAVLDPNRLIAGRSRDPDNFVGRPATPSLVEEIGAANESFFYALNQEGQRVYTAFSKSAETGWTAAVGAPAHLVEGPLRRAQWTWIGGGIAAVALAALLAWLLTRSIVARQTAERRALQLEGERQSEARLTDIAARFPGVMYRRVLSPDGQVSYPYLSNGITDLVGEPGAERLGEPNSLDELPWEYILPEDRAAVRDAIRASAENLAAYDVETRISRPDGAMAWVRSMASTRRDRDGLVVWDGVLLDITPLKEAENALKAQAEVLKTINSVSIQIASELDRDRLVQFVLDAGRGVVNAAFGAFFYNVADESGESYMLYALSGAKQEDFAGFPMPRNTGIFGPTFRGEGIIRLDDVTQDPRYGKNEPFSGMPEGHLPVRSYLAVPVISRTGDVLGGLFFGHPEPGKFDEAAEQSLSGIAAQAAVALENAHLFKSAEEEIAQRKEIETQQQMLLAELNHRVKNTLAVVLAIAQQTARTSSTMEHFGEVFRGRIMALANAHTLLTAGNWLTTSLRCLVATALEPYSHPEGGRVFISGPEVMVPPKQALALSLVFHELATNASKYGALSKSGGTVHVEWSPADDEMLSLRWREHVEGEVKKPEHEGFGSRLITMNVSREVGGSVHREYAPDGLSAELRLPWDSSRSEIVPRKASNSRSAIEAGEA